MAEPARSTPTPAPVSPAPRSRGRRIARRLGLGFLLLIGVLLVVLVAGGLWLRSELRASLPQLDGRAGEWRGLPRR